MRKTFPGELDPEKLDLSTDTKFYAVFFCETQLKCQFLLKKETEGTVKQCYWLVYFLRIITQECISHVCLSGLVSGLSP